MLVPWYAANFKFEIVGDERLAEVAAVIFDGVGRFVVASEQSDDALLTHFSTRKLPMTRESMPELKKVRNALVGVSTMASPRRLKELFMMTGTPAIAPRVTEGITLRFSGRTCAVGIMNGESYTDSR